MDGVPHPDHPSVSVVVATFDGAAHLAAQLESLAAQTVLPDEVVVTDDASSDATIDIARRFAEAAPFPVRVLAHEERLGYAQNFMRGVRETRSTLVAFCDQDDVWLPRKLEAATAAFASADIGLFAHAAELMDDGGRARGRFRQGIRRSRQVLPRRSDPWGVLYGFSIVVRRELLDLVPWESRGPHTFEADTPLSHDLWCYFLATSLSTSALSAEALVRYRQHGGNATPPVRRSLRRFTASMGLAADGAVSRAAAARHRAEVLLSLERTTADPVVRGRAGAAGSWWRRVAKVEVQRELLYSSRSVADRGRRWLALVLRGAYRGGSEGALPRRTGVKDLLAGVAHVRRRRGVDAARQT